MNRNEYQAVFADSHISDRERSLYLYLRWHMDYDTAIVGIKRRISYQSIREHLEFNPERGSREKPYSPTNDQIKRLLRKLEKYGWIERLHTQKLVEFMAFRLVYAVPESLRSNEERQMSATGAPPLSAPQQNPVNTRAENTTTAKMSAKGAPPEERHTSDTSDKDLSLNARARATTTGSDLEFNAEFLQMGRNYGPPNSTPEEIEATFDHFRFHRNHHSTLRDMMQWRAEWRTWMAGEKKYATKQQRNPRSGAGGNQRSQNPTNKLLHDAKGYSQQLAQSGYYDQADESDDDIKF
ncbi:hypothetical protein [Idiomarina sp.]|uniref:hypothetical protein n=1 Tax=Idiomarina sp. TaxID=1874361 RepID=UPI0025B7F37A|nr:hypothetical protein [Idiomarina sp.]